MDGPPPAAAYRPVDAQTALVTPCRASIVLIDVPRWFEAHDDLGKNVTQPSSSRPHWKTGPCEASDRMGPMSELGHGRKNSEWVYVFRITPGSGHFQERGSVFNEPLVLRVTAFWVRANPGLALTQ